jgi:hypothetical protein
MPQRIGYCLAMNRDEKRTRAEGLPPAQRKIDDHDVLCPSEPGGGTWIALNSTGVSLALINWYSVGQQAKTDTLSRGGVIPSVITDKAEQSVDAGLNNLPLDRINPFRLIGVFPSSQEVFEWRWDLKQLVRNNHLWRLQQWVSSGFDEPRAQEVRGRAFERAQRQKTAGSLVWLRRLHCSHWPQEGPFSTCMHREDAVTVSYAEVSVLKNRARMWHVRGSPCSSDDLSLHRFQLPQLDAEQPSIGHGIVRGSVL